MADPARSCAFPAAHTVQNKAEPADARLLLERLQLEFEPFGIVAEALLVWRYLGGPWEAIARLPFSARGVTRPGPAGTLPP